MRFNISLNICEETIMNYAPALLDILLFDRATRRNIIWATDDYAERGIEYSASSEIRPELITGFNSMLIRPRIAKSIEAQESRTRGRAEVFTPCWVCNVQNNLVDEQWFGRSSVFNIEGDKEWETTGDRIQFPDGYQKTWKKYIDAKRLEITCGEAPYLVSRYDTVSGAMIPIKSRIGLLDRKLRVVNENTDNADDWFKWALRAFQSVYGYEFQGDNLLLARENLLATFIEYYQDRFGEAPTVKQLCLIAHIKFGNGIKKVGADAFLCDLDAKKYLYPKLPIATFAKADQRRAFYHFVHDAINGGYTPLVYKRNIDYVRKHLLHEIEYKRICIDILEGKPDLLSEVLSSGKISPKDLENLIVRYSREANLQMLALLLQSQK